MNLASYHLSVDGVCLITASPVISFSMWNKICSWWNSIFTVTVVWCFLSPKSCFYTSKKMIVFSCLFTHFCGGWISYPLFTVAISAFYGIQGVAGKMRGLPVVLFVFVSFLNLWVWFSPTLCYMALQHCMWLTLVGWPMTNWTWASEPWHRNSSHLTVCLNVWLSVHTILLPDISGK